MFHLFHTNDFHSRLTPGGARGIREAVEAVADAPCLLLDAGDAVKAGNLGVSPGGEPIFETMNALGYAAMTVGNRETHPSRAIFAAKIGGATFPILCANVRARRGGELPLVPHIRVERGGCRIGVFGVTVPMVTERSAARVAWDMVFEDPVRVARDQVAELRPQCDVLFAMTHVGHAVDRRIAESVPGIDCIVSGHSHLVFPEPVVVAGIPILQAGSHGRYVGHATWDEGLARYELIELETKA
ncbi:MAG: bifunctional metallophosphatase/5'-nucleotidase [Armatimonadota bacterium]